MSKQRLPSAGTKQPGSLPLAARESASILDATAGDEDIPHPIGTDAGLLPFTWRMLTLKRAGSAIVTARSDLNLAQLWRWRTATGPRGMPLGGPATTQATATSAESRPSTPGECMRTCSGLANAPLSAWSSTSASCSSRSAVA